MLSFLRRKLFQNCQMQHWRQFAAFAYQFKQDTPIYYPNRSLEMQGKKAAAAKTDLVAEKVDSAPKMPRYHYYSVLGLHRHATTQEIKSAYYKLAKRLHPDATQSSHALKRFQEVTNAYHILTDEAKRQEYDQLGMIKDEQKFLRSLVNQPIEISNVKKLPGEKNYNINMDMLKSSSSRDELSHITNRKPKLELTFLEAALGGKKKVDLQFLKSCPACEGRSPKFANRQPEPCRKCLGKGKFEPRGYPDKLLTCERCDGKGYSNRYQCNKCDCRGFVQETIKTEVHLRPGTETGEVVSVLNPRTKQRVLFRTEVLESDYYQRVGHDIRTDLHINISDAVLGGEFKVRGLYEPIDLKIEPGTESHTEIVLRGKGIKSSSGTGNHIVKLKVRIPRKLSMKQYQLILAFAKTEEPTFEREQE